MNKCTFAEYFFDTIISLIPYITTINTDDTVQFKDQHISLDTILRKTYYHPLDIDNSIPNNSGNTSHELPQLYNNLFFNYWHKSTNFIYKPLKEDENIPCFSMFPEQTMRFLHYRINNPEFYSRLRGGFGLQTGYASESMESFIKKGDLDDIYVVNESHCNVSNVMKQYLMMEDSSENDFYTPYFPIINFFLPDKYKPAFPLINYISNEWEKSYAMYASECIARLKERSDNSDLKNGILLYNIINKTNKQESIDMIKNTITNSIKELSLSQLRSLGILLSNISPTGRELIKRLEYLIICNIWFRIKEGAEPLKILHIYMLDIIFYIMYTVRDKIVSRLKHVDEFPNFQKSYMEKYNMSVYIEDSNQLAKLLRDQILEIDFTQVIPPQPSADAPAPAVAPNPPTQPLGNDERIVFVYQGTITNRARVIIFMKYLVGEFTLFLNAMISGEDPSEPFDRLIQRINFQYADFDKMTIDRFFDDIYMIDIDNILRNIFEGAVRRLGNESEHYIDTFKNVKFTYKNFITIISTIPFKFYDSPRNISRDITYNDTEMYQLFWNGIDYDVYTKLSVNSKLLLKSCAILFGLYDVNDITYCDILHSAIRNGYIIKRVCILPIPINGNETIYTKYSSIKKLIMQNINKSRFNLSGTSSKIPITGIGLSQESTIKFKELLIDKELTPMRVIGYYMNYLSEDIKNNREEYHFDKYDPKIKDFVRLLLIRLGFNVEEKEITDRSGKHVTLSVTPKFIEHNIITKLRSNLTLSNDDMTTVLKSCIRLFQFLFTFSKHKYDIGPKNYTDTIKAISDINDKTSLNDIKILLTRLLSQLNTSGGNLIEGITEFNISIPEDPSIKLNIPDLTCFTEEYAGDIMDADPFYTERERCKNNVCAAYKEKGTIDDNTIISNIPAYIYDKINYMEKIYNNSAGITLADIISEATDYTAPVPPEYTKNVLHNLLRMRKIVVPNLRESQIMNENINKYIDSYNCMYKDELIGRMNAFKNKLNSLDKLKLDPAIMTNLNNLYNEYFTTKTRIYTLIILTVCIIDIYNYAVKNGESLDNNITEDDLRALFDVLSDRIKRNINIVNNTYNSFNKRLFNATGDIKLFDDIQSIL